MASSALLSACSQKRAQTIAGQWVGASFERGHQLRNHSNTLVPAVRRRAGVLIVGAGVAGLAAARALARRGVDDVHLFELEDRAGGNARGHSMGGMACPLGAHYLPVPTHADGDLVELLIELGLAHERGGRLIYDERQLSHSPQERLLFGGQWHEGLLPPAAKGSSTLTQYQRFASLVAQARRDIPFAMPTHSGPWRAGHLALDRQTFGQWLIGNALDDPKLRWYLDHCCRDDYGAGLAEVSSWAGLNYFASRHGFSAPGQEAGAHEPVLTWPDGNAHLTRAMAKPFADRLHTGNVVLQVDEERHGVSVLLRDVAANRMEQWQADQVILAVPLFVAARLLRNPPAALALAVSQLRYASWMVANVQTEGPLLERLGAPLSWDNVVYSGALGRPWLGFVDAMHQSTRPHAGSTVLSSYYAFEPSQRQALLDQPWAYWSEQVMADLLLAYPAARAQIKRVDLMRYGHAMSIPAPGVRSSAALAALAASKGRVRFAHADLSGFSIFEEAFAHGMRAGGA